MPRIQYRLIMKIKSLFVLFGVFLSSCLVTVIFQNCAGGGGGAGSTATSPSPSPGPGAGTVSTTITVTNQTVFSGSLFDSPRDIAVDDAGQAWVTDSNASGKGVVRILPDAPADCAFGCLAITGQGLGASNLAGLAIDSFGNVWLKDGLIYKISNGGAIVSASPNGWGSGSNFYGSYPIAIDSAGNAWFGNISPSVGNVGKISNGGAVLSSGYSGGLSSAILSVITDGSDNVWVATINGSNVGKIVKFPAGTPLSPVTYTTGSAFAPVALAVDPSGNIWVANNISGYGTGSDDNVIKISPTASANCTSGCTTYTGSFLHSTQELAADEAGNIWVANGLSGSITKIAFGAPADCSTGCFKYTSAGSSNVKAVAIDGGGNVWMADSGKVVRFPGLAAATTAPIASQSRGAAAGKFWAAHDPGISDSLTSVAFSGSIYVAVGNSGRIITSPDSINWTSRSYSVYGFLNSVIWSGSQFVAVGAGGVILTSVDGISWTQQTSGTTNTLSAVASSGSMFLVVGTNVILTSPNAVTWTVRAAGPSANYSGVAWSGSRFIAVSATPAIDVTPDGITWASVSPLPGACGSCGLYGVAASGSRVVAVGGSSTAGIWIMTSTDVAGLSWTADTTPTFTSVQGLFAVAWSGSQFVTTGFPGIATSPDGINWTARYDFFTNLFGVTASPTRLVAVGGGGKVLVSK